MVEALDAERSDAIAAEIMENPAEKMREENKHTKEKVVTVSIKFFTKTAEINSTSKSTFLKMPVGLLEIVIKNDNERFSKEIQKHGDIEKIESLVTIAVAGNEVFRENKTFDQLGLTAQAS